MKIQITTEETYHISKILKHYANAKEKHPYFLRHHHMPIRKWL